MKTGSLMGRLRAARPAAPESGDHDALLARIVAGPGDPRLALAPAEFWSRPPARRSRPWLRGRPRLLAGSTLGLAGAGTALALALTGSAAPPAFAITRNVNGSVLVKISRLESLPEANHQLAAMGIREQVTIYMAAGRAVLRGPVDCRPAPGARPARPRLKVLVGRDGTDSIGPGRTAGVIGVDPYHLVRCVVTAARG